jgi:hypothetical protein
MIHDEWEFKTHGHDKSRIEIVVWPSPKMYIYIIYKYMYYIIYTVNNLPSGNYTWLAGKSSIDNH